MVTKIQFKRCFFLSPDSTNNSITLVQNGFNHTNRKFKSKGNKKRGGLFSVLNPHKEPESRAQTSPIKRSLLYGRTVHLERIHSLQAHTHYTVTQATRAGDRLAPWPWCFFCFVFFFYRAIDATVTVASQFGPSLSTLLQNSHQCVKYSRSPHWGPFPPNVTKKH